MKEEKEKIKKGKEEECELCKVGPEIIEQLRKKAKEKKKENKNNDKY